MTKLEAVEDVKRGEDTLDGADTQDKAPDPDYAKTDGVQKKPRKPRKKPAPEPSA